MCKIWQRENALEYPYVDTKTLGVTVIYQILSRL